MIRANAGDWIEITLHNLFDKKHSVPYFDYPIVPLDKEHKPSMRVSLNRQFLRYDPVRDSGINVGYNHMEQTVAPGVETFREYVMFIQNGIRLLDKDGNLIKTTVGEEGEEVDAEDTGEKGYNYRSERFANRLKKDKRVWKVFSSKIHGDPATPVCRAYSGDRVIFRTVMPADKPRNVGFAVHGHAWKEQRKDPFSRVIPLQGAISVGNTFDMELEKVGQPLRQCVQKDVWLF